MSENHKLRVMCECGHSRLDHAGYNRNKTDQIWNCTLPDCDCQKYKQGKPPAKNV